MSIVNDEPLMGREEGRNLYEESDKLLRLAEGLQDRCEQYERRLWTLLAMGATIPATLGAGAVYLTVRAMQLRLDELSYNMWMWAALVASFYAFASIAYLSYMRARIHRQITRERRALHSIVDMLRDLDKGIAEKDNLSTLERAEFRIRLSRFDIGAGE